MVGSYLWSDNTPYDGLGIWNEGEPNDPEGEQCVEMLYDNGKWNDIMCNGISHIYVCKAHRRKNKILFFPFKCLFII
jgi:hypothetical protein